ncbi:MAG: pyridoxal phosphate-dependent aminotransferase family protein [Elusimicrobiales bacterium]|jgi:8-amino-7-oxononanoate synthase|nr:pyridoxal phosphate-dependent aminotransferase family protein [Elusimicrobiales bacterium]NLH39137.1 pyridoxal phosphate-dependent aminotransferase family protein [Elusimicrobiota bacterium]
MYKDLFQKIREFDTVKELKEKGIYPYFKALETEQAPEVTIGGKRFIMFGSNNYLGLANDPRMKDAAKKAIDRFGTGVAGSRFLNGNTVLHEELEKKLAKFKRRQRALVYATGYQMNVGVVSALATQGDVVIVDKLDHASIIDGCRMSGAEIKRFKHNDMADLEKVLKSIDKKKGKLIMVDGVFSMEGDIAPLPDILEVAKKYNARVIVDDAHATGVIGKDGRGTSEYFGLENGEVDLVVGTCSKSFATIGGFVVGDSDVIDYIQHISRSMIFSAALPPGCVASISKAIDIIENEPERRKNLWDNSKYLLERFKKMGCNIGPTQTPIIPILIGDNEKTFRLWRMLFDNGVFSNPVISPAVPPKRTLLRVVVTATHTREQLDRALEVFEKCYRAAMGTKSRI